MATASKDTLVLVTGASGFIAGHCVRDLLEHGYAVRGTVLPYWPIWIIARFGKTIRLALEYVGRQEMVSCEKAQRELGWSMRPVTQTIIDTGHSMIEYGIVPTR